MDRNCMFYLSVILSGSHPQAHCSGGKRPSLATCLNFRGHLSATSLIPNWPLRFPKVGYKVILFHPGECLDVSSYRLILTMSCHYSKCINLIPSEAGMYM